MKVTIEYYKHRGGYHHGTLSEAYTKRIRTVEVGRDFHAFMQLLESALKNPLTIRVIAGGAELPGNSYKNFNIQF